MGDVLILTSCFSAVSAVCQSPFFFLFLKDIQWELLKSRALCKAQKMRSDEQRVWEFLEFLLIPELILS